MIRALFPVLAILAVWVLLADGALACAVCSGGDDDVKVKDSYVAATIFMSLLPLCVVGGGFLFLRHRYRATPDE